MRSYGQYCSVAKALDVVGDRWTLLIVRELLLRDACRYTDLRSGLPGIATNLLAARLRELELAGIVSREEAAPPIASTLFRLTPRGRQLRGTLVELARWGAPLMTEPGDDEEFRSYWLMLAAELFLRDRSPDRPPVTIEVRTGGEPMLIETVDGGARARQAEAVDPDAVLSGTPDLVIGVLSGRGELSAAEDAGVQYEGDPEILLRVRGEASVPERATELAL